MAAWEDLLSRRGRPSRHVAGKRFEILVCDFDALRHRKTGEEAKRPLHWFRQSVDEVLADHRVGSLDDFEFRLLMTLRALASKSFNADTNPDGRLTVSIEELSWYFRPNAVSDANLQQLENTGLIRLGTDSTPDRYRLGTEPVPYGRTDGTDDTVRTVPHSIDGTAPAIAGVETQTQPDSLSSEKRRNRKTHPAEPVWKLIGEARGGFDPNRAEWSRIVEEYGERPLVLAAERCGRDFLAKADNPVAAIVAEVKRLLSGVPSKRAAPSRTADGLAPSKPAPVASEADTRRAVYEHLAPAVAAFVSEHGTAPPESAEDRLLWLKQFGLVVGGNVHGDDEMKFTKWQSLETENMRST